MPAMRDVFWDTVYNAAKIDRNIVILSDDFSAPALDKFRLELPSQYIFGGISEQNIMLVAAGLALEGKKPICYAIAPFLAMRCFEQTRLYAAGMDLPIILVGVGAGISYEDSGYTHHAVEDIAIMRTLPHMTVCQPCDNKSVQEIADFALKTRHPVYVRLDRYGIDELYSQKHTFKKGFHIVAEAQTVTLVASGNMVKTTLAVLEKLKKENIEVGVIDLCTIPVDECALIEALKASRYLLTLEEHVLRGGIGSYVLEVLADHEVNIKVKRVGLDYSNGFSREYGGRDVVHKQNGMDEDTITNLVKRYLKGV